MSFSANVKSELARHFGNLPHCYIAEIAAIINMCGHISINDGDFYIKIQTENAAVARNYFTLVKKTFNIDSEVVGRQSGQYKKMNTHVLLIKGPEQVKKILTATGILQMIDDEPIICRSISPGVVCNTCCKRAYIRGAFIASGSVSDPEKTYHLEFVNSDLSHSEQLRDLIATFGIDAKIVERKEHYVVYIKDGEQIVDLLNVMEAHVALMDLENVRILKDMRNNVNRIVNCETANLSKTINASIKQQEDINYIIETEGLHYLPENLREIAQARIDFPELTLKELGEMLENPLGKSGVNHRLRKISEMADILRKRKGEIHDREDNYS